MSRTTVQTLASVPSKGTRPNGYKPPIGFITCIGMPEKGPSPATESCAESGGGGQTRTAGAGEISTVNSQSNPRSAAMTGFRDTCPGDADTLEGIVSLDPAHKLPFRKDPLRDRESTGSLASRTLVDTQKLGHGSTNPHTDSSADTTTGVAAPSDTGVVSCPGLEGTGPPSPPPYSSQTTARMSDQKLIDTARKEGYESGFKDALHHQQSFASEASGPAKDPSPLSDTPRTQRGFVTKALSAATGLVGTIVTNMALKTAMDVTGAHVVGPAASMAWDGGKRILGGVGGAAASVAGWWVS